MVPLVRLFQGVYDWDGEPPQWGATGATDQILIGLQRSGAKGKDLRRL